LAAAAVSSLYHFACAQVTAWRGQRGLIARRARNGVAIAPAPSFCVAAQAWRGKKRRAVRRAVCAGNIGTMANGGRNESGGGHEWRGSTNINISIISKDVEAQHEKSASKKHE